MFFSERSKGASCRDLLKKLKKLVYIKFVNVYIGTKGCPSKNAQMHILIFRASDLQNSCVWSQDMMKTKICDCAFLLGHPLSKPNILDVLRKLLLSNIFTKFFIWKYVSACHYYLFLTLGSSSEDKNIKW